jgi:reductive dehalogenase
MKGGDACETRALRRDRKILKQTKEVNIMSKFHSTVTRRDFMKALGFGTVGLGAAAATTPVFHDLDELMSSPGSNWERPWWIKKVDKPTVEIDWTIRKKWGFSEGNPDFFVYPSYGDAQTRSRREAEIAARSDHTKAYNALKAEKRGSNEPGFQLKDRALKAAAGWGGRGWTIPYKCHKPPVFKISKPETRYTETSSLEIDDKVMTSFYAGRSRFEDCDEPYEIPGPVNIRTNFTKVVIPNKYRWMFAILGRQEIEMTKHGLADSNTGGSYGYKYRPIFCNEVQVFLGTLGYGAVFCSSFDTEAGGPIACNSAAGILSGQAELGRVAHILHTNGGPMLRGTWTFVTDLPLPQDSPIDAGMWKFCQTCKKCSEACHSASPPGGALSNVDEPTWEVSGPWNNPGLKAYPVNYSNCACGRSGYCDAICVFSKHKESAIHDTVKATLAVTPIFNGFFRTMDDAFGYGMHDSPEDLQAWWDRDLNDCYDSLRLND